MTENVEKNKSTTTLENAGRRKAVKTIVGGITAVAAYNMLPTKWGTPIIESVFLPAHAQTSAQIGLYLKKVENDPSTNTITLFITATVPGSYTLTIFNQQTSESAQVTITQTVTGGFAVSVQLAHAEGDTLTISGRAITNTGDATASSGATTSSNVVIPPTDHIATPPKDQFAGSVD